MYVIIDLDHTIANSVWRNNMIGHSTWDEYYVASKDDKPFQHMVELINAFIKNGDLVIAITDRMEKYRALTIEWLVKNNILVHDLLLRPDDSYLKSNDMKIQLLRAYFNSCFEVVGFAIDTNEETLLEFQKLGITTLQVANVK